MFSLYQKIVQELIEDLEQSRKIERTYKNRDSFELSKKRLCKKYKVQPMMNSVLIKAYRKLLQKGLIKKNLKFERLTIARETRTISGVTPITVLTKPYQCPGQCIYCPHETNMPVSYLSNEPAAQRAKGLNFDPYQQVQYRIKALETNGHVVDKIELLILGGSWNAYTRSYQNNFIAKCFQAANDYPRNKEKVKTTLEKELKRNEKAKYRIIGETLETRPDLVSEKEIIAMRNQGCTRVQLGIQHTDDAILKKIKRGHGQKEIIEATRLSKQVGLKVDYHLMPDLPYSSPAKDFQMFQEVFSNPDYQPDQIKIYPCVVTKEAKPLYNLWKNKKHQPYTKKQLLDLLVQIKVKTIPYYVRINRLIRDIPKESIVAGNDITNLRQNIHTELKKKNQECKCIRCREIKNQEIKLSDAKLFIKKYPASDGWEYFISYENKERTKLYAFLRLRFNNHPENNFIPELKNCSIVREIHAYGKLVAHGQKTIKDPDKGGKSKTGAQHLGFGKKLMMEAEKISRQNNYSQIAVISGIGVREYYRKLRYKLKGTYMIKKI
jgi:ELP3 family radical SAM enzyme/protein acetyltransferase